MAGGRFLSAREVFASFPTAAEDLRAAPTDDPPLVYLGALRHSATPEDAISFLAYWLGRREAVWWAAQSVRLLARIAPGTEDAPLEAAEAWVREPEDERRRDALRLGMNGNKRLATTWVALAAGWAGGNIAPSPQTTIQATPEMTPKAVRTAILIALATVTAGDRLSRLQVCVEAGIPLAQRKAAPAAGPAR